MWWLAHLFLWGPRSSAIWENEKRAGFDLSCWMKQISTWGVLPILKKKKKKSLFWKLFIFHEKTRVIENLNFLLFCPSWFWKLPFLWKIYVFLHVAPQDLFPFFFLLIFTYWSYKGYFFWLVTGANLMDLSNNITWTPHE